MYFLPVDITFMHLKRVTRIDHGLIVNARYDPELGFLADEPDFSNAMV
ncbi:MAG: hypothetical protein A4E35_00601 [Methanoregula sp. PtaU1.Bin051]|nr:MAG: hypothetical protein A4E35_00601 [Methanoregula sp. PtaU1.Bin051]